MGSLLETRFPNVPSVLGSGELTCGAERAQILRDILLTGCEKNQKELVMLVSDCFLCLVMPDQVDQGFCGSVDIQSRHSSNTCS